MAWILFACMNAFTQYIHDFFFSFLFELFFINQKCLTKLKYIHGDRGFVSIHRNATKNSNQCQGIHRVLHLVNYVSVSWSLCRWMLWDNIHGYIYIYIRTLYFILFYFWGWGHFLDYTHIDHKHPRCYKPKVLWEIEVHMRWRCTRLCLSRPLWLPIHEFLLQHNRNS